MPVEGAPLHFAGEFTPAGGYPLAPWYSISVPFSEDIEWLFSFKWPHTAFYANEGILEADCRLLT